MVYVVKPATAADGTPYVKSLTNRWRFASANIPQAFLYASIEKGRDVYLRPPKICVDFGLVGNDALWRLKTASYGFRESPKLWEKEKDDVLSKMKLQHTKLCQLKLVQSKVHASLWLVKDTKKKGLRVRFEEATTIGDRDYDHEHALTNLEFPVPLALMAVYVALSGSPTRYYGFELNISRSSMEDRFTSDFWGRRLV
eukprot:5070008-Amphidinium_carterae.1